MPASPESAPISPAHDTVDREEDESDEDDTIGEARLASSCYQYYCGYLRACMQGKANSSGVAFELYGSQSLQDEAASGATQFTPCACAHASWSSVILQALRAEEGWLSLWLNTNASQTTAILVSAFTGTLFYAFHVLTQLRLQLTASRLAMIVLLLFLGALLPLAMRKGVLGTYETLEEDGEHVKWEFFALGMYVASVIGVMAPLYRDQQWIMAVQIASQHVLLWVVLYALPK